MMVNILTIFILFKLDKTQAIYPILHRTSLSQFQLPAPSNFFPPEAKQALISAIFSRPLGENADLTTIEHRGRGEKEQPEVGPKGE
jgi:hypothetical protein